jgi:hypothetical protein
LKYGAPLPVEGVGVRTSTQDFEQVVLSCGD